jgi:hypothetical protein
MRQLWLNFLKALRSPGYAAAYAAVVTFLSLFAGLLGALYPDEVKAAFPFYWGPGTVSWHAVAFWSSALGAAVLFFAGQRASDERLDERAQYFEQLIRSLPPSDFLFTFKEIYKRCNNAFVQVLIAPQASRTQAVVQQAIRVILNGVATLAQRFDAESPDVTYGANVMRFRAALSLDAVQADDVRKHLIFNEIDREVAALRGILDLDVELSTTTETDSLERDARLNHIILPVPKEVWSKDGKRLRVLPGAPLAFCLGVLDGYEDTLLLGDWCRKQEISETVAQEVDRYFSDVRRQVRSFISLPLRASDDNQTIVGVMNVHRNKPGLLNAKAPAEQFEPLVGPFQAMVAHLLRFL